MYVTAEVASVDGKAHDVQLYLDAASDLVASYPSSPEDAVNWEDVSPGLQKNNKAAHGYRMYVHGAKQFAFNGDSTRPNWGQVCHVSPSPSLILSATPVLISRVPVCFCLLALQLYFATDSPHYAESTGAAANLTRSAFLEKRPLPPFDMMQPVVSLGAAEKTPVLAMILDLSTNSTSPTSGVLTLFYDEVATIDYFGTPLLPYWKHQYNGDPLLATVAALEDYAVTRARADAYDHALIANVAAVSGDKWATLLALAHREVTGATTVVWNEEKQTPWWFIKEMSTGGALSTVDVLFPGAPLYIAIAPEALKLMLWPILSWSNNETNDKVTINWSPHDLGGYPIANADAAHQEEMPLEESGNMILMLACIAQRQHGDVNWLVPYRAVMQQWVDFMNSTLPDPDQQLCTDDFEGPSPHNANLAVKGIVALNGWALLLRYFGDYALADTYDALAKQYAMDWMMLALDSDTSPVPHYKQRYDQNRSQLHPLHLQKSLPTLPAHLPMLSCASPCSTWSTKYNLIFQYGCKTHQDIQSMPLLLYSLLTTSPSLALFLRYILGSSAFPDSVRTTENAYYQTQANKYGIPLDNRHSYQKSDWFSWMGALAFDNAAQQNAIIDFLYNFADTSPDRQPFSDLYDTTNLRLPGGFIARFVMGGLYSIPILNAAGKGEWPAIDFLSGDNIRAAEQMAAAPKAERVIPLMQE